MKAKRVKLFNGKKRMGSTTVSKLLKYIARGGLMFKRRKDGTSYEMLPLTPGNLK